MKPPISHLRVFVCRCVVRKSTATFGTKVLNICHQAQNNSLYIRWNSTASKRVSCSCTTKTEDPILVQCFLIIVSLVNWRTRHNHMQKLWLFNQVCNTYLILHLQREQTVDIITFAQLEEGYLLS